MRGSKLQMVDGPDTQHPQSLKAFLLPAVLLIGVLPLLVLSPAPLADWASHLSRVEVTERVLHGDPFWTARYFFQGLLIPNAVLDAVVLGLVQLGMSLDLAGMCFLVICYGCFVSGFIRLARIGSVPPVVAASLAVTLFYTGNIMFGLLNYVTGLGLTMLASAYCLQPQMRLGRRCLITLVALPVILFCHILAAGMFVAIYGAATVFHPFSVSPPNRLTDLRHRTLMLVPALIASAICLVGYRLSPVSTDKLVISWADQYSVVGLIYGKIKQAAEGLSSGFNVADAMMVPLIAVILWCLWRNRNIVRPWQIAVVATLALLPLLAPFRIGEGMLFDTRMFVLPLIAILTMLRWASGLSQSWQLSIVVYCSLRTLLIAFAWLSYSPLYQNIKTAFAALPPGSTLLSAYSDEPSFYLDRAPPLHNIAALAVRDGVFVPSMFAEPSQQPLVIRPKWRPTWSWDHSANARNPANLASVRERARLFCRLDPKTHLFMLHVTQEEPFTIESPCDGQ